MDPVAIEQMNKLRKSLGLPLLGPQAETQDGPKFKDKSEGAGEDREPASTLETREAAGYANFQQIQEEEKRKLEREKRKKAIQKARDAAARLEKLEGKGLGDIDEDVDAKSWLRGSKQRQKEIERERARKLEEELAERERLAAIDYTSSDLAGVQVAHEVGDFDDGTGEQILTLKDQEIGKDDEDVDGDVLENAELLAKEKLQERLDAKKKIRYDIHDDEKKELLSQYDEKKRKAFTLDAQGSSIEERESKRQAIGEKLKNAISLDILKPEAVSDYQEIKIKKPKKVKKHKRQKEADEDDMFPTSTDGATGPMDVDAPASRSRTDTAINDDEDLSSALNFSRKAALKKKKLKPEDLVKQLKEEEPNVTPEPEEGGIVLDDTTTFLDNINTERREPQARPVPRSTEPEPNEVNEGSPADEDEPMADANQAYAVVEGDEQALLDNIVKRESSTPAPDNTTGLEREDTLDNGVGAALKLLRGRGVLKETDPTDRNAIYRQKQMFIEEQRLREHQSEQTARQQRERDRLSGKNKGLSRAEQEEQARWQNERRSQQTSIQAAAAFNKEYKPVVELKYVDDSGRVLNQKEAFKHLSHQFHGKGSGKQKTEKQLKKIEEEKRREAKSVLDTGRDGEQGLQRAQGTMGKKANVAGVRLG